MKILPVFSLLIILLLGGCASNIEPALKGGYQSEMVNGYTIQLSFQPDDSSFVEYIDNREVDRGTYEKVENNAYKLKSSKQNVEITLSGENSFGIVVKKINDGKPIPMKHLGDVPTYFSTKYDDVDEYKNLLE